MSLESQEGTIPSASVDLGLIVVMVVTVVRSDKCQRCYFLLLGREICHGHWLKISLLYLLETAFE